MPNTITAFSTFIAGETALSSQMNTNFSNFRGDLIPIHPISETSTSETHDIGSGDYRFLNAYINEITLKNASTSTTWAFKDSSGSLALGNSDIIIDNSGIRPRVTTTAMGGAQNFSTTEDITNLVLTIAVDTVANDTGWFFMLEGDLASYFSIGTNPCGIQITDNGGTVIRRLSDRDPQARRPAGNFLTVEHGAYTSTGFITRKVQIYSNSAAASCYAVDVRFTAFRL